MGDSARHRDRHRDLHLRDISLRSDSRLCSPRRSAKSGGDRRTRRCSIQWQALARAEGTPGPRVRFIHEGIRARDYHDRRLRSRSEFFRGSSQHELSRSAGRRDRENCDGARERHNIRQYPGGIEPDPRERLEFGPCRQRRFSPLPREKNVR